MIDLSARAAIVTGAGAGLGRSYAVALAARGAKVLVNDIGAGLSGDGCDPKRAEQVATEIVRAGGTAVADTHSVASPEGGAAIVEHALEAFGTVDILINNAGNMQLSSFAKLDTRTLNELLDVHLGGTFNVTQPAWRQMVSQRRGRIIVTGSGIGAFGTYGAGTYAAAKGGVAGLLNVLELEAERRGIRVNGVAPMAHTRMAPDDLYSALPAASVRPELVAQAVVYLASDECAVNGEMWTVGAGSVARLFVGRTEGLFKHPERDGALTAEDVAANVSVVQDTTRFSVPASWPEEWQIVVAQHRSGEPR